MVNTLDVKTLAQLVNEAKSALLKAQQFADQHALSFTWMESYGSSQQIYVGKGAKDPSIDNWNDSGCSYPDEDSWSTSDEDHTEGGYLKEGKWVSSSDDC